MLSREYCYRNPVSAEVQELIEETPRVLAKFTTATSLPAFRVHRAGNASAGRVHPLAAVIFRRHEPLQASYTMV
jgi:hypothetical protein